MSHAGRIWLALAVLLALFVSTRATAHGLRPGVLTVVEHEPGVFAVAWSEPIDTAGRDAPVEIVFPAPCRPERLSGTTADTTLDCGPDGLDGAIELVGLQTDGARVMVLVRFADGRSIETLVTDTQPQVDVTAAPGRSVSTWIVLGIEHIVFGIDHVAFVLGLLLVVGTQGAKRLIATITAFTLAHSITLILAATGTLVLASAPVEATIAASVVLVARESMHDRPTVTRTAPWAVAFGFGLVHGLGFAGALAELGLPEGWATWSLVCFNVGVEVGQLAIVLASAAIVRVIGPRIAATLRRPLTYAIGGLAAYWLLDRVLPMLVTAWS